MQDSRRLDEWYRHGPSSAENVSFHCSGWCVSKSEWNIFLITRFNPFSLVCLNFLEMWCILMTLGLVESSQRSGTIGG